MTKILWLLTILGSLAGASVAAVRVAPAIDALLRRELGGEWGRELRREARKEARREARREARATREAATTPPLIFREHTA
jgi:hypothetical protein